jgi:hypothetical protein
MSDMRLVLATTEAYAPEFVGLTEAEADALAARLQLVLRCVRMAPPGEHASYALSADLMPKRLTLWLRDGRVLKADAG